MTRLAPSIKLDTEFERAFSVADKICLIQADQLIEADNGWNGRFADPDGSNGVRLNQRDRRCSSLAKTAQSGSGHPSGGTASGDDEIPYDLIRFQVALSFPTRTEPKACVERSNLKSGGSDAKKLAVKQNWGR